MIFDSDKTILLIIDIQEKLLNSVYNSQSIKKNARILSITAEKLNIPIFITEQYPKGLGETIQEIKNSLHNSKNIICEKIDFNAFSDKNIYNRFRKFRKKQVIICGIETHICVHQTAESLLNNGYEVAVVTDACGSRYEAEHNIGIENIKQSCGWLKTTEMILFELLKSAKHPYFKDLQLLIK